MLLRLTQATFRQRAGRSGRRLSLGRERWCALVLALEGRAVQVRGEWEGVIEQKLCSSPFGYPHARSHRSPGRGRPRSRTCARLYPCRCATTRRPDRKRVGQGKSVSVRVDLGGRCIIKKK